MLLHPESNLGIPEKSIIIKVKKYNSDKSIKQNKLGLQNDEESKHTTATDKENNEHHKSPSIKQS